MKLLFCLITAISINTVVCMEKNHQEIVITILYNSDVNINKQDTDGNSLAHLLPPIHNRHDLTNVFNAFIITQFNPHLKNKKQQTPKEVALENYSLSANQSEKKCYASNANLFNKLEMDFDKSKMSYGNVKFILENDNDTITSQWSPQEE